VPANVAALLLDAEEGSELSCRTASHTFTRHDGTLAEHGIISHYAAAAVAGATTAGELLVAIEALVAADVAVGVLPASLAPRLRLEGPPATPLP
jgi:hypothetical protein